MSVSDIVPSKAPSIGYPRLDFYTVTSTLDVASVQAERGAPHGTLITASHQTSGRGRRGAAWRDEPGASALLSFVLRPPIDFDASEGWRIGFVASLAVVEALRSLDFPEALVKWPNDLVLHGRKVGGLLVETRGSAYLLGIGINVAQEGFADSSDYAVEPVSLRMCAEARTGPWPNAVRVSQEVCAALSRRWDEHLSSGPALLNAWRAYQLTGQRQRGIDLVTRDAVTGVYVGVRDSDGAGLLRLEGQAEQLRAVVPAAV